VIYLHLFTGCKKVEHIAYWTPRGGNGSVLRPYSEADRKCRRGLAVHRLKGQNGVKSKHNKK